jgi:hypothetical protein
MRIIRNMPTGHANSAATLRAPLAIAPDDKPKDAIAAKRRSGVAQQIVMATGPLNQFCPGTGQQAGSVSDFPTVEFSAGTLFSSLRIWSDINHSLLVFYCCFFHFAPAFMPSRSAIVDMSARISSTTDRRSSRPVGGRLDLDEDMLHALRRFAEAFDKSRGS